MSSTFDLVAEMMSVWPRHQLGRMGAEIYVRELSDVPTTTLEAAGKELMRSSEFFPSIRSIRERAAEITLRLPSEEEALSQVERRISTLDSFVHADVKRALDHVGGYFAFRTTTDPAIVRGQFMKVYRQIRADRIQDLQIGGFRAQIEAVA